MDFKQAETSFKQLKSQFEAGALSENAFKVKLEELMIQDERGEWWMIGYETERWYRNNGSDWVQADPPGSHPQGAVQTTKLGSLSQEDADGISDWSAMFLVTLGWVVGGAVGGWLYWSMDDFLGLTGGIVAGVIGGLVTGIVLNSAQTRYRWKSILWIALGWMLAGMLGWPIGEALTEASGAAVGGAIFGAIGWGITSRFVQNFSNWKSALWVILTWTVSAAIGWIIARQIQFNVDGEIGWPVGRAISGAISGFILSWQIKKR